MTYTTIISAVQLAEHIDDPAWAIIDSRFKLVDLSQGWRDYETAHIAGAVYAHLEMDLSGPILKGKTGRHPLPSVKQAAGVFSQLGIDSSVQVVAYDDMGGALAAGRVWWMLRWLGHESVAVLDGGWQKWLELGLPVRSGIERRPERRFIPHPRHAMVAKAGEVEAVRHDPHSRLIDVRAADRFRGENEIIDPIPGHIPGAISAPYIENLKEDGTFQDKNTLAARYRKLLMGVPADKTVFYCGSGVTATHGVLAMMIAGLGEARLYDGSYSEWITDPDRPVDK